MPIGSPGKEQFRDAIVEMRNLHIAAGLALGDTIAKAVDTKAEIEDAQTPSAATISKWARAACISCRGPSMARIRTFR